MIPRELSPCVEVSAERPPHSASGWRHRLTAVAAVALATLWLWSAMAKWGVPKAVELYGVIRDVFPWIPAHLAEGFALGLPKVELLLSVGLLLPWSRRWAGFGSMLLLGGFTVFLLKAWLMGYQHSCGCFGSVAALTAAEARQVYGVAVLRNCGLLLVAGVVCRGETRGNGASHRGEGPVSEVERGMVS